MNSPDRAAWIVYAAVAVTCLALLRQAAPLPALKRDNAMAMLADDGSSAFRRAREPIEFEFPRDHGLHAAFRTEWWYFTGQLGTADGSEYGFQLTLFRFEIDAGAESNTAGWRTPRVILGHFALSDLDKQVFHSFERLSRAVDDVAGTTNDPIRIWLDDWRIDYNHDRWQLTAAEGGIGIDLTLVADSNIVAQGDNGLSRKSVTPGNASYYYSVPRLTVHGAVRADGPSQAVTGRAWLDREWSTSALDHAQAGWDWFALDFDNAASLMLYRLRRHDGKTDPLSAGTYVDSDGHRTRLSAADFATTVTAYWTSPHTGVVYPAGWRITIERLNLVVDIKPRLADQEWRQRFRYWEGAVSFAGNQADSPVSGRGYVELTGYTTP